MKIEVTCSNCRSILRVDVIHAGKQVRCPACDYLTLIPDADGDQLAPESDRPSDFHGDNSVSQPEYEQPTSAPISPPSSSPIYTTGPNVEYPNPIYQGRPPADGKDTIALVLGGLSIGSAFFCACFSAIITPALSITGFCLAVSSNGPSRGAAIVTNIIGMVLWILSSLFWFFTMFLG